MQLNMTETSTSFRLPVFNLRWGGIFGGLVVGVAVNLLLLLVGVTVGLATFNVTQPGPGQTSIAAAVWNTVCMIIAAFVGGYVAARGAGMRRASDGVLHGVVAWGITLLVSAFLATSATSAVFGSLFATGASRAPADELVARLQAGDRQAAITTLQNRLGMPADQASRVVDQALIASGRPQSASPRGREEAEQNVKTATAVSSWLSGAVILSLLAAIGGGLLGARGARRTISPAYVQKRHVVASTEPAPRTVAPVE